MAVYTLTMPKEGKHSKRGLGTRCVHAGEERHGRAASLTTDIARTAVFALPNVVVTPHVGWLTPETLSRSIAIGFENCRRVRSGEPLLHRVV